MLYQRINRDCFYFRDTLIDLGDIEQWIAFGKIGFYKEHEGYKWLYSLRRQVDYLEKKSDRETVTLALHTIYAALYYLKEHGYSVDTNLDLTHHIPRNDMIAYCDEVFAK